MASIGLVNAGTPKQENRDDNTNRDWRIYFGVFFDGTGNNMIQQNDAKAFREGLGKAEDWDLYINHELNEYGAHELLNQRSKDNDYSNVAILHSCYRTMNEEELTKLEQNYNVVRFNIYVEGAGTDEVYKDTWTQDTANAVGSGFGAGSTGVVALVSKAVAMIRKTLKFFSFTDKDEIHFDVFGFSRGAACARLFSYLVVRPLYDRLHCEKNFGKYSSYYNESENFLHFLDVFSAKHCVDFLGIYDTVSSIGVSYKNNVVDYGLYSPSLSGVKNTFHICAMDEFRSHFGLTDIGGAASINGNAELFIPGCHSDIGGGYLSKAKGYDESFNLLIDDLNIHGSTKMYVEDPQNKNGEKHTLNKETLEELGWLGEYNPENKSNNFFPGRISVLRRIKAGYNTIPLRMMATRAHIKTDRDMCEIPNRFAIPDDLKKIGNGLIGKSKEVTGQHWYYPNNSYKSQEYRKLRSNYLHFSATDSIGLKVFKGVVHAPSKQKNAICRIVYPGDGVRFEQYFMTDYDKNSESI